MTEPQCKLCPDPCRPRKDRPGKFYTMCDEHYRAYMRTKNRESYARNIEIRRTAKVRRYWEDPAKAREIARRSAAKPDIAVRRRAYMQEYLRPWRKHVKVACERCGWEPGNPELLDVHHIDMDKTNNDPSNLETLCPNCHRLHHVAEPPKRGRPLLETLQRGVPQP